MCAVDLAFCAECAQDVRSGLLRRMCAVAFCAECAQWASAQDVRAQFFVRNGLLRSVCAMGFCAELWLRRILVLPGTTLPVRTAKVSNMGEERRRSVFHSAPPPEPPLSLVILARCLAGNQPSGPLREEGGGDVSLLGMRPLYFSDIQQERHSHHF
ncbi:unnamed protein product [Pleuronectes platessa]|uniref:Uncharacterized protein n=1 Tax=Pleuronectes platessa TaxID=8262 RepID=A0A9N7VHV2_PLEPL|nr:unnamed protein product [Pleuronectes platessa]